MPKKSPAKIIITTLSVLLLLSALIYLIKVKSYDPYVRRSEYGLLRNANQVSPAEYAELAQTHNPAADSRIPEAAVKIMEEAERGDAEAQFTVGKTLLEAGSYTSAEKFLTRSAEQGNAPAQKLLGNMYANGTGIGQNFNEAFSWYYLAAKQGNTEAQAAMGILFYIYKVRRTNNTGTTQIDPKEIYNWLLQAAEKGNSPAEMVLGKIYLNGDIWEPDYQLALQWFEKAVEHNNTDAQIFLGAMYEYGVAVPIDLQKAKELYMKAAAQGCSSAINQLKTDKFK